MSEATIHHYIVKVSITIGSIYTITYWRVSRIINQKITFAPAHTRWWQDLQQRNDVYGIGLVSNLTYG